jgi:hypothetical protein
VVSGTRTHSAEIPPPPVVAGATGTGGVVESSVPSDTKAQERVGGAASDETTTTNQGGTPTDVETSARIGTPEEPAGAVMPQADDLVPGGQEEPVAQFQGAEVPAVLPPARAESSGNVPPPSQAEGAREDEGAEQSNPSQVSSADDNEGLAEAPGASGGEGAPSTADDGGEG